MNNNNQNNNNNKNRELTYNEAKALLAQMQGNLTNRVGVNNVEFGEDLAKKNNSNNEQSAELKTAARKDNNVKKENK